MRRAYVCGTFDTKGPELGFLVERLCASGLATCSVDVGTLDYLGAVDVPAREVACNHPAGAAAVLGLGDRGAAVAAMAQAFERFVLTRDDIAGIIGAGRPPGGIAEAACLDDRLG